MIKHTLLLLTALGAAATAAAVTPAWPSKTVPARAISDAQAVTDASGYTLRFCDAPAGYVGPGSEALFELYIEIPGDVATKLVGNKVTKIGFSTSFTSETLQGEIFVDEGVNTIASTYVDLVNNSAQATPAFTEYSYDTPYEIRENTAFCVGVRLTASASDYPIGFSDNTNTYQGHINYKETGATSWTQTTPSAQGFGNLCIYAVTEGPVTSVANFFEVNSCIPHLTLAQIEENQELYFKVTMTNYGSEPLEKLTFNYTDPDRNVTEQERDFLITERLQPVTLIVPTPAIDRTGRVTVRASLTSVNGEPTTSAQASMNALVMPAGQGFDQRVFVEEGSGTWCGFCPRGIVGMDYMAETYPDNFIGVVLHYNDDMQVSNYQTIITNYLSNFGFPSAVMNRDSRYVFDPNTATLEENYNIFAGQKSVADIKVEFNGVLDADTDAPRYSATARVKFAQDFDNARYRIAYVTAEDGISDKQTNYFSAYDIQNPYRGQMSLNPFWDNQPYKVDWTYDNTARGIFTARGVANSLPTTIVAGEEYVHNYDQITVANIDPAHDAKLIALLLDYTTGVVINSARVDIKGAGIDNVMADTELSSNAPVEWFNLQGQPVANPEGGIFIRRQGRQATKVMVR